MAIIKETIIRDVSNTDIEVPYKPRVYWGRQLISETEIVRDGSFTLSDVHKSYEIDANCYVKVQGMDFRLFKTGPG